MAKKSETPTTEEAQIKVTALRFYPGNGEIGIAPWKENETRILPKSQFDKLAEDMPHGWIIQML